jgi:CRISPR-associated exonuclease Cas4
MTTSKPLRINEIKNYLYCPRISYYTLCLDIDRETDLSRGGIREEARTKTRMQRRKGALHALLPGERHFDVPLENPALGLIGRLDELVETADGVVLIDYKDTAHDYGYWGVQMLAYRLCAEAMGWHVQGCALYIIPEKRYQELETKPKDEAKLRSILAALHTLVQDERCPPPVTQIGKCRSCQYSRFCNDIF